MIIKRNVYNNVDLIKSTSFYKITTIAVDVRKNE